VEGPTLRFKGLATAFHCFLATATVAREEALSTARGLSAVDSTILIKLTMMSQPIVFLETKADSVFKEEEEEGEPYPMGWTSLSTKGLPPEPE